jgi:phosphotriesterase-related protein
MTVNGPIAFTALGLTLPHEHIMVDFTRADQADRNSYPLIEQAAYDAALPHLVDAKNRGVDSLFECTPQYVGRYVPLLKRLATDTGVNIITNTGYYGAGTNNLHLPAHAFTETADQIAARWVAEWRDGIDGTGVRPGFIKIAVTPDSLSDVTEKLVRAAARTHIATGLTIASHTSSGAAMQEVLEVLKQENVHPSAFVWVHASSVADTSLHEHAARRGAWTEFDAINADTVSRHVQFVANLKNLGLLNRVLVSHDAGWYDVQNPSTTYRGYSTLFTDFVPALQAAGFSQAEIDQILIVNPHQAFGIRVRSIAPDGDSNKR